MSQIGLIYILKHSSGTTVKVGETIRDPQDRLNEYRKAYDLKNFSFYKSFEVPANARQDVERIAHQILQQYQLSGLGGAREIFSCAPDLAERAVRDAIQKSTVARVEKERQQKIADETERKRLVEQRRREEVKKLEAHAELEWSKKPSTIELKRQLQNF